MSRVILEKISEAKIRVGADSYGILTELSDYLRFRPPGYQFMPAFKAKRFDGYIRLLDLRDNSCASGLQDTIRDFCIDREYDFAYDPALDVCKSNITREKLNEFINSLNLPFPIRDYQFEAVYEAVKKGRRTVVSSTGSGKSLIIYIISRFYLDQFLEENPSRGDARKVLIVVPTVNLVSQLYGDFADYSRGTGWDPAANVQTISAGADKVPNRDIVISTYHSIYQLPKAWFHNFKTLITDECHLAAADSLSGIALNCTETPYRFGLTGTLKDSKAHKTIIIGHFGSVYVASTTEKLMDEGHLAKFKIKAVVLKYPKEERKDVKGSTYSEEIDWIVGHERRNKFICKLATSLPGNTLVLYTLVQKHGMILYDMMKSRVEVRGLHHGVHHIYGGSDKDDRENIRRIMEENDNQIVVGSAGVLSTGANIKNLHNIIFASPSKARIRVLQSIGRSLRLHDSKEVATLYDIADDLSTGKKPNFAMQHFGERVKIYSQEGFTYTISSFDI